MNGGIINYITRLHLVGYLSWVILRCTDPWILNSFYAVCIEQTLPPTRLPIPYCLYQAAYTRLPIPGCLYQAAYTRLPIPGCLYQASYTRLPIPGCLYQAAYTILPIPGFLYQAAYTRLPIPIHVQHTTPFKQSNQPDATVSQVYYLTFICRSTCFRRPHAHHQELTTVLTASDITL
jgi:hypothetical protein